MKLTRNFSLEELKCRDGTPVPETFHGNAKAICERAQVLRDLIGEPLVVTSGYRTQAHNKRVKGARRSQHLTASALDLRAKNWSAEQLAALYEGLVRIGAVPDGGLGVYPVGPKRKRGWIHIDLGRPRRWVG